MSTEALVYASLGVVCDYLQPKDLLLFACCCQQFLSYLAEDVGIWSAVLRRASQRRLGSALSRRQMVALSRVILPAIAAQKSTCVRCWKIGVPRALKSGVVISVCNACTSGVDPQLELWDRVRMIFEIKRRNATVKPSHMLAWFRSGALVRARVRSGGAHLYWASDVSRLIALRD